MSDSKRQVPVSAITHATLFCLGAAAMYLLVANPSYRDQVADWLHIDVRQQCLNAQNWCRRNEAAWGENRSWFSKVSDQIQSYVADAATDVKQHVSEEANVTRVDLSAKIEVNRDMRWVLGVCILISIPLNGIAPFAVWVLHECFFCPIGLGLIISTKVWYLVYMFGGTAAIWVLIVLNELRISRSQTNTAVTFHDTMRAISTPIKRGKALYGDNAKIVLHTLADMIKATVPGPATPAAATAAVVFQPRAVYRPATHKPWEDDGTELTAETYDEAPAQAGEGPVDG
jgi:hypothetical protein